MPARTDHVVGFNKQIGVDVKHLRGWKVNQKGEVSLKFFAMRQVFNVSFLSLKWKTSQLLRKLFDDHWIAWAGVPKNCC